MSKGREIASTDSVADSMNSMQKNQDSEFRDADYTNMFSINELPGLITKYGQNK